VQNRHIKKLRALILALGIVAANASASNSPEVGSGHRVTWLRISAFTDVPLAEGDVAVYDTAGRRLFQKHHATNSQGVFPARIHALPPDFRVTVTWDGHKENDLGRLLLGGFTLSADVQNFDPVHGIVYVNPVTTIVSRVLDRSRGNLTLQQVQALVRRFFILPPNASLGAALREGTNFRSRYFSQKAFLTEAASYRGVEPFLQVLQNEMLAQPEKAHSFASAAPGAPGGVASWFAEKLAGAAVSWAAGEGIGWVAKQAGVITPDATVDDIANLQNGLADLQSSVDELNKQMEALAQQLTAKIDASDYRTTLTPALALASLVDGVQSDLNYFVQGCPPLTDSSDAPGDVFCDSQKATIIGELNEVTIIHSYETLLTYVLDNQALLSNGMIHQFSLLLGETVRFFRPADSTKIQNTFDYWDSVLTQAANLKVELLHLNDAQDNAGGVKQLTDFLGDVNANPPTQGTLQNTYNAELQLMFPAVPLNTVINTKDRMMWATNYPRTDLDWCSGQGPGYGEFAPYPATEEFIYIYNGKTGWSSPDLSFTQTLIDGWTGASPSDWLINQTKAEAPDSPTSPGFPNVVNLCVPGGWVWTQTWTGHDSGNNQVFYIVDLATGAVNSNDGIAAPQCDYQHLETCWVYNIPFRWQIIARGLERGEQYYWYQ